MAKRFWVSLGVLALAAAGAAASLLSDCADSTSWYYEDRAKTCEAYVSKKSKNCKKKDEFKVKGEDASAAASLRARAFPSRDARHRRCPLTCGVCSSSDCEDSTSWY